jgi:hypothetical protein
MARRSSARSRRHPVPFALALPPRGAGAGGAQLRLAGLRAQRDRLVDRLSRIDAACWRGELSREELWLMQRLRRRFAALDGEIARREQPGP